MKELVELIAKSLVDNPDEVHVNEIEKEKVIILELQVAKEDTGKVIGKQGKIAKAIRTVVKAAAIKEATEYYNKNAKPGSLAAKANMVKQYNEKNNK